MASLDILTKISVPTSEFKAELIQELLIAAKIYFKAPNKNIEHWNQILEVLWQHMKTGFQNLEDQLLCATCFYTILGYTENNYLLPEVLEIIKSELHLRKESNVRTNSNHPLSLMYGIFQSSFLTCSLFNINNDSKIACVLTISFRLLISICYEYSHYTFLAFKIIRSFNKVCGTKLEKIIFNEENNEKLLNLVIHNWENPITGVRDLLKDIFKTVIMMTDDIKRKSIAEEINELYWNKAKYLMLSVIVEADVSYQFFVASLTDDHDWVKGLLCSLHKPGLVSAGTDLYIGILNRITSQEKWCEIFLKNIIKALTISCNTFKLIENFCNYWCLVTLKKFPYLMKIIIDELGAIGTEQKLYSSLFVIKQGNKLGILNKWKNYADYKEIDYYIMTGLEHVNPKIRMLAFEIICYINDKSQPIQNKYDAVLYFVYNNLNSDCTILRLSLLNSIKYFLSQLHIGFLNYIKDSAKTNIEILMHFCRKFQQLLIDSLHLNGNYQRKITTIKAISLVWACFSKTNHKTKHDQKEKQNNITIVKFLTEHDSWMLSNDYIVQKIVALLKDPGDDIRENAITLLINYYSKELVPLLDCLIEDAFTCMKSKFFYEIMCGQTILKLITKILLQEQPMNGKFKTIEDIFYVGYNELIAEYPKGDIMNSIENGKQIHSFIGILYVVIEVAITQKYLLKIPNNIIESLLNALGEVANQFSWEPESSISSDFSKMNDMVQDIIIKSGYDILHEHESKISSLHQIVLNSLWLNVKVSCDLASLLVQYYSNDFLISEKCLKLICNVLETSRHKGAIESAGSDLGRAVQCLTSLPASSISSNLPYNLLVSKLQEFIYENDKMASITRRGAGLSIMVHRIVSGDMQKRKPLFHYFMNTLLDACNVADSEQQQDMTSENNDLPKAIYIHFLTRIVTDSSLSPDVLYYSASLAKLAFNNLTSSHWQIRNAALQLYGALIPREIGQKKASGTDHESIATVACDELRTHSPKLWEYIKEELANASIRDDIKSHSDSVPILNLLASSAKRYNFISDLTQQGKSDEELFKCLTLLLGSPIYTVRRLTAKSIYNIFSFDKIYNYLLNEEITLENMFHGCLMLIENCYMGYHSSSLYDLHFSNLRIKYINILNMKHHSHLCHQKIEDIFHTKKNNEYELENVLIELDSISIAPGKYTWANRCLKNYIRDCSWNKLPNVLRLLLSRNDIENYFQYILSKIESQNSIPQVDLLNIVDTLLSFEKKESNSLIWKILYLISLKIDLSNHENCILIMTSVNKNNVKYIQRYIIPFAARIFATSFEYKDSELLEIIFNLTDPDKDVDMRYIAALANNEMANAFHKLSDINKVICIKSVVILLQDEDEDVRSLSVGFYKNIKKLETPLQPYICLQKVLDPIFLNSIFYEPYVAVPDLHNSLSDILSQYSNCSLDEYNPFAQSSKNIYFEADVFKQFIEKLQINEVNQ